MATNHTENSPNKLPLSLIVLLGATPLLMAAAPLSFSPVLEGWQIFLRAHSFIVLPIELLAIFGLMSVGSSVVRGWNKLPWLSKYTAVALVIVSALVSFGSSKDHLAAAIGLSRASFAVLLGLALLGRDGFGDRSWRSLWLALGLGAAAYFGLLAIYMTVNPLENQQWVTPFPGFNNIRHAVFLGLIAYSAGLAYLLLSGTTHAEGWRIVLLSTIGIVALTFVIWTGSRGPLLSIIIATIFAFMVFKENRRTILSYAMLCFGAGITIASLLPIPNPNYGVLQAFGIADVSAENLNGASSGRLEILHYTLEQVKERPLFGWGVNQYAHFLPENREQLYHPHNFPVQLLFASGFLGALLLLTALVSLVWQRISLIRSDAQKFNAVIAVTLLFYSLYDGIFYFSYPMMIFVIVFIGCLTPPPAPDTSGSPVATATDKAARSLC